MRAVTVTNKKCWSTPVGIRAADSRNNFHSGMEKAMTTTADAPSLLKLLRHRDGVGFLGSGKERVTMAHLCCHHFTVTEESDSSCLSSSDCQTRSCLSPHFSLVGAEKSRKPGMRDEAEGGEEWFICRGTLA